jgi:hypothetical protein
MPRAVKNILRWEYIIKSKLSNLKKITNSGMTLAILGISV